MLSSILAVVLFQLAPRPSVVLAPVDRPYRNIAVLYYDDSFLFASRDFGRATDCGGNTEQAFFVHSKQHNRWMRIEKISTEGGHFGTSRPDNDPVSLKALSYAQVGWEFRGYATRPYIEQPLRTSGSIAFPEQLTYDADSARYDLRYFTSWKLPVAETRLFIVKADLTAAFEAASQDRSSR